jgi:Flp pilus assembly pilin Flp
MCTLLGRFFIDCGAAPTFEYMILAAGIAVTIVFLVRPQ